MPNKLQNSTLKKGRILGLAQIGPHSDAYTLNFGLKTQINS